MLPSLQQEFLDFLTGKDDRFLAQIAKQGKLDANTRGHIYKNAYYIRLKKTIETDHEMLGLYLGDALFDEMVAGYTRAYPSHYRSLRHFSNDLPQYLSTTAPFNDHPILAELADFEGVLLDVFDAADIARASLADLQAISPAQWPTMRLYVHPSIRLFTAHWNSVESWQALRSKHPPPPAAATITRRWLLWRDHQRLSEFRSLDDAETLILQNVMEGTDFASICSALLAWYPPESVSETACGYLQRWLQQGLIARIAA